MTAFQSRRFEGKVALITGGGSGIGRAIAIRLAGEGANIVLFDLDASALTETAEKISAAGPAVTTVVGNVADHVAVAENVGQVLQDKGRLDVLVNNAGIAAVGNLEACDEDELDRIYRVNVKGVYNLLHAVVPAMATRGAGVILNMGSIASLIGITDRFAYSMSKGAVLTMTLSVAKDYVDKGIRCNCICPARVHTPFVDGYLSKNFPGEEQEMFEKLSAYQPIGRMGKPEEVAALAAFLCSDEASFITGAAYTVDGGVTSLI